MTYSLIENFSGGVDRRRPVYALPPGTLWDGINCHITRGGDIEKRKAFVDQGVFSSNTFGLLTQGEQLWTFGSDAVASVTVPSGCIHQRLQHPDGLPMAALLSADLFGGSIYAIAQFAGGEVLHFYNGTIVSDWTDGIVRASQVNLTTVAAALAALINASPNYTATSAAQVITVTAQTAGVPFTVSTLATDGGAVGDGTIVDANTTPNTAPVTGVGAACGFSITAGTTGGSISSLLLGGVEILGVSLTWGTSNTATATLIAAGIETNYASTNWHGTSSGEQVTIYKGTTGIVNNGLTLAGTWAGTLKINNAGPGTNTIIDSSTGGVDTVAAVAQVDTLTLGGTFDPGDGFGVKMVSGDVTLISEYFGSYAKPFGKASWVKTHKRKLYVGAGSLVDFCAVNDATGWNVDIDPGAGFINASTHVGGSEVAVGGGTYQGQLAIYSPRAIQLWLMQNDDTLNDLAQVIENTGTRSPRSIMEFGGNDVFYLDESGIRSLRARDASNNAYLSDVGVAIDRLVRGWISTVSDAQVVGAATVIEPIDGRFMLSIGTRIFVYSYYPTSKVVAWTWYDLPFTAQWMVRTKSRLYVRGDDNHLYLYGGQSGSQYDASKVTVQLPFFTSGKPGTYKGFNGLDMSAFGTWNVLGYIDPSPENNGADQGLPGLSGGFVDFGSNIGVTFQGANWMAGGHFTHMALKLTNEEEGYASLSNVALFYDGKEESK